MNQRRTWTLLAALTALVATGDTARPQGDTPATTRLPYPIVDTGQVRAFGLTGPIPSPAPGGAFDGQDGQYAGNLPRYKDNGDGTVSDLVTGLMWQKAPAPKLVPWREAAAYARKLKLAGHTDWRVPTMKELFSIADFRGSIRTLTPYIDTKYFTFAYPETSRGGRIIDVQYWSSNLYAGRTMAGDISAFGFNFADGRIKSYPVDRRGPSGGGVQGRYLLCVRGNPYGINDLKDNGDGTVTDRATGLTWTRADAGRDMNWGQALTYAEKLELAGHKDWRLPNVKELQSLVDYTKAPDARDPARRGLAIDPVFRLGGTDPWCWTSTTHIENGGAYYVCFGRGLSARLWRGAKMNAHGAGAVRSDPKWGDPSRFPQGKGPQGDEIRIRNRVLCVRGGVKRVQAAAPTTATPNRVPPSAAPVTPDRLRVMTVGTGSPAYNPFRAGPSALVRAPGASFLVDMGNGTQARLSEAGVDLGSIRALLFTHHHLDHNEELIPILIKARLRGGAGVIIGPPGTKKWVALILETYREDLEYRARKSGRTWAGLAAVDVREVAGGEKFVLDGVTLRTARVAHTIHTVAYRFDRGADSVVISGDTSYTDNLVKLAKGADILVMDSGGIVYRSGRGRRAGAAGRAGGQRGAGAQRGTGAKRGGVARSGSGTRSGGRTDPGARPGSDRSQGGSRRRPSRQGVRAHPSMDEVARMAAGAGVAKLVLVHFRAGVVDVAATLRGLAGRYKGEVLFGVDKVEYTPGRKGGVMVTGLVRRGPNRSGANASGPGAASGSRFIQRLDKNGDGKVSRQEFDGPPRAFARHDRNGDGYIDASEAPDPRRRRR